MKKHIQSLLGELYWIPHLVRILRKQGNFVASLVFHDILPSETAVFRDRLSYLGEHFTFVDFQCFDEMMIGKRSIRGGNLLLTFDDGFSSAQSIAETILNPMEIRAVFFIPTGFLFNSSIQAREQFVRKRLLLNSQVTPLIQWSGLEKLVGWGHHIGAHGVNHCRLSSIDDEAQLWDEIVFSGDQLAKALGVSIELFAYPFGTDKDFGIRAAAIASQRYKYCFTTVQGWNRPGSDPARMKRIGVWPHHSLKYSRCLIETGCFLTNERHRQ